MLPKINAEKRTKGSREEKIVTFGKMEDAYYQVLLDDESWDFATFAKVFLYISPVVKATRILQKHL